MEDLIGRSFGGYELKELVGTGGMASIYKAFDEKLSRWVAIKVAPIFGAEETMLARFRQEAQAMLPCATATFDPIYGYGEDRDGSEAYIVMEYVLGGSLKEL